MALMHFIGLTVMRTNWRDKQTQIQTWAFVHDALCQKNSPSLPILSLGTRVLHGLQKAYTACLQLCWEVYILNNTDWSAFLKQHSVCRVCSQTLEEDSQDPREMQTTNTLTTQTTIRTLTSYLGLVIGIFRVKDCITGLSHWLTFNYVNNVYSAQCLYIHNLFKR